MGNRYWPPTRRCWDKGQQIELEAHLDALVAHKRAGRAHRDTDRLVHAIPQIQTLLNEAAKRGSRWGAPPVSCRNCLMCMGERR